MALAMGFSVIFALLINFILPLALLIILQVWLCTKGGKLGLILPILSFVLSLILCIGIGTFSLFGTGGGSYIETTDPVTGEVIWEEHHNVDHHNTTYITAGALGSLAVLFLVSNIPTVVFGGIWKVCGKDREIQSDLKRMQVEDLE